MFISPYYVVIAKTAVPETIDCDTKQFELDELNDIIYAYQDLIPFQSSTGRKYLFHIFCNADNNALQIQMQSRSLP